MLDLRKSYQEIHSISDEELEDLRNCCCRMALTIFRRWGCTVNYKKEDLLDIADMGISKGLERWDSKKGNFKKYVYYKLLDGCREFIEKACREHNQVEISLVKEDYFGYEDLERKIERKDIIGKWLDGLGKRDKIVAIGMINQELHSKLMKVTNTSDMNLLRIKRKIKGSFRDFLRDNHIGKVDL